MKNYMGSFLKKVLKKRKRITEAIIVMFLITGGTAYGETYTIGNNEILNNIEEAVLLSDIANNVIGNGVVVPVGGYTEVINNGEIGGGFTGTNLEGQGRYPDPANPTNIGGATTKEIIGVGNGIILEDVASIVTNNGKVEGLVEIKEGKDINGNSNIFNSTSYVVKSGNGISGNVGVNNGSINGEGKLTGGKANYRGSAIAIPGHVYADTLAESVDSGNGVSGNMDKNNGLIAGNIDLKGGTTEITRVNGYSWAKSNAVGTNSGNGIVGDLKDNNGIVIGNIVAQGGKAGAYNTESNAYSYSHAYGLYSGNGVYGEIENNNGMIKANAKIVGGEAKSVTGKGSVNNNSPDVYADLTSTKYSGNGVKGVVINNNGVIIGNISAKGSNGILENNSPTLVTNYNAITHGGSSIKRSGNGVYGTVKENNGLMSGFVEIKGGSSNITIVTTDGISARMEAYGNQAGNGVRGTVTKNSGVIKGESYLKGGEVVSQGIADEIKLNSSSYSYLSGNGIMGGGLVLADNSGLISGNTLLGGGIIEFEESLTGDVIEIGTRSRDSGNGVYGLMENNSGVIRGNSRGVAGKNLTTVVVADDSEEKDMAGSGFAFGGDIATTVTNKGIIGASEGAIVATSISGNIDNYGIFAGRVILGDGTEKIMGDGTVVDALSSLEGTAAMTGTYVNYGIEIKLNNDADRTITSVTNGSGGTDSDGRTIINTSIIGGTDSYEIVKSAIDYTNNIVNGVGFAKGTITIDNTDVTIDNSIINGYEKAVTLEGSSTLIATDTVFNGGGIGKWNDSGTPDDNMDDILKYTNVIEGDNGNNSIEISGISVVNGAVDLGGGDDIVTIGTDVQINGDIYGGDGSRDILIFANSSALTTRAITQTNGLSIFHTIGGFEDISVSREVTLYETAKVEDAPDIHIEALGSLNLRIDPTKTSDNGRVTGHGLYGSNAVITTTENTEEGIEADTDGGAFNIITNGLGVGGVIAMSDDSGNQVTFEDNPYVRTDSIITMAEIDENADIKISVGEDLDKVFSPLVPIDPADPLGPVDPTDPVDPIGPDKPDRPDFVSDGHYEKLDLIYKSIVSSGDNINALYPTVNTNDKTMDLAGENLLLLLNDIFMANPYGYTARTSKDSMGLFNEMVLNNPFRANEGNWMVYGGLTFGGDDYDSNYKNYIKGDYYGFDTYGVEVNADSNAYGGYALIEYGLDKNTSVGFVLGGANSNTDISNGSKIDGDSIYVGAYAKSEINNFKLIAGLGYQYGNYDTTRVAGNQYQFNKYEEDITTDGFSAYTGLSYDYALNSKWSLEPKFNLVYSRVIQDSISEEGILSIETDKESFNYVDTEIGMDLVRKISLDSSEGKFRLGLSYVYALEGSDADYVTGRYQGGSDFDILVPERDKGTSKIKASYDVEYKSGIVYSVGGAYLPSKNRDEYYVSVGVGFKFNNLKDFNPTKTSNIPNVKKEVKILTVEEPAAHVKIEKQKTNAVITDNISGFNLNSSKLRGEKS